MSQSSNSAIRSVPQTQIVNAWEDVAEFLGDVLRMRQANQSMTIPLIEQRKFHAKIMRLYLELRPYRDAAPVADMWDTIRLWPVSQDPSHPESRYPGRGYLMLDQHVEVVEEDSGRLDVRLTESGKKVIADEEWVRGVDTLETWMNRPVEINVNRAGRSRGTEEMEVPAVLPTDRLIDAARAMNEISKELGIGIELPDEFESEPASL